MRDQAEFDAFYATSRVRLLRQLSVMTTDPELAKDVLQDAYERAWQRWSRVAALEDPEGWVRTVAWRAAVSTFRRRSVAARFLPRLGHGQVVATPASEEAVDVQRALRSLPAEQRRAVVLHHVACLPVEAIARETGVPVGTVKSRLSRGRAALAAHLGEEYYQGTPAQAGEEGRR